MAERLGDLCFDTLREEIKKQIEGLLQIYFHNALVLPPGKRIQDIATRLHHDSESLEQLLTILKNITELGLQSIRGILLNRRNIPIMSIPIESMFLAVNSNFLVFSVSLDDMMGQSFASLVSTVADAESAIGRKSLGNTFKVTLDGRIQAIQEESQQFPNPNEVIPPESNEQQRLLRISLRIYGTVVESLPMACCAPKCEKTVQALLCRNLNVKSATLPNATSSRRIRLQDDLGTKRADPIQRQLFSHEAALQERSLFPPGVLIANASYASALNSLAQALSKPVKERPSISHRTY
ncbi:hypothetical protein KIW84_031304 [Lathyrus oleraceus]|uniref:ATP synthase protein MI25 n=1 Tax=Pisum sativum TaxID=3888 RepID=A0A9D4XSS2_PEA|nr:hypothetical protein KIW84_031304 [Pisum sativum]